MANLGPIDDKFGSFELAENLTQVNFENGEFEKIKKIPKFKHFHAHFEAQCANKNSKIKVYLWVYI